MVIQWMLKARKCINATIAVDLMSPENDLAGFHCSAKEFVPSAVSDLSSGSLHLQRFFHRSEQMNCASYFKGDPVQILPSFGTVV